MKKENYIPAFLILLFLAIVLFFLSKAGLLSGPVNLLTTIAGPFEKATHGLSSSSKPDSKITAENKILVAKLKDMQKLTQENSALRDQFETSYPASQDLLPANIVSAPSFVPGVSSPEYLVIDKGKKDNVKIGSAVVFKDNLVGKVVAVSDGLSKVMLVSNPSLSISAKTISLKDTNSVGALGILKGLGGESLVLDNVLLSDNLQAGDYVTTKGDMQIDNTGYPPSLIVGKITSVEKKASDLFQKAKVRSMLDFSKLNMVFVVI